MDLLNLDPDTNFLIGILDLVPVYIYWKDSQGRILGCNKIQAEALGYKNKNDLIGKTDYDFYDKEKADAIFNNDMYILKSRTPITKEELIENYLGEQSTVLSVKRPITLQNNEIGVIGVSVDISELKQAQLELLQAKNV